MYKCIAKILANRLRKCLSSLICWNQSAFVEERRIIDNILLALEIVKDYDKPKGKSGSTLKIDIMEAFDSVRWKFVVNIL